jgi:hypothetical protein
VACTASNAGNRFEQQPYALIRDGIPELESLIETTELDAPRYLGKGEFNALTNDRNDRMPPLPPPNKPLPRSPITAQHGVVRCPGKPPRFPFFIF